MTRLTKEEAELVRSLEKGEWRSVKNFESERKRFMAYAHATCQRDHRVSVRISTRDFEGVQKKALVEGVPYQTLIASIVHKYVSGILVEKKV